MKKPACIWIAVGMKPELAELWSNSQKEVLFRQVINQADLFLQTLEWFLRALEPPDGLA